jgi:hypothetical protein
VEVTARRFCSALAMAITATVVVGFGTTYMEMQKRHAMSDELAQWELREWKENLLTERQREFIGGNK